MQADKTTLEDLAIFNRDEEASVFHYLDFTRTNGGKEWLRILVGQPLPAIHKIEESQRAIQRFISIREQWSNTIITNGTIMVIERFFETVVETIPAHPSLISSTIYRILNGPDYSLIRYSIKHCLDFLRGLEDAVKLLSNKEQTSALDLSVQRMEMLLNKPSLKAALPHHTSTDLTSTEILRLGHYIRHHYKEEMQELIQLYSKLDAWYSMAVACTRYNFQFPSFVEAAEPLLEATELYHPLLSTPIPYSVELAPDKNFLFLTGANMAGKSTFIKATGIAVYLAHIGMGVPAKTMRLSVFDGLLSNINVVDNIIHGESYFFNEVQRIRKTIEKISDGKKWLILIDELFKGTNVQDAMKCSTVVIEGLRHISSSLFILSTHLYEIGEALQKYPNIQFRYFETMVQDEQLVFSYQLKEGISNDRLGFLILKREKVLDLLEKLSKKA